MSEINHPYQHLTPDAVIDAVESTGIFSDARILALNSYENRVYQVGIEDQQPVIVKFYRPQRWTDEQIQEEHQFAMELADLDIPVVPPNVINGETLLTFNNFQFAIYERRGGHAPELDNLDHLLVMARFIARIHQAGASKNFQHRPEISIKRFAEDSMEFLLNNDFLPRELITPYQTLAEDLIKKVKSIFAATPYKAIRIHGDCHTGNVLYRDETPHFVDFDDTMMGPAIQDLWMMLSGDRNQKLSQLSELADGYNEFYDFQTNELPLIEALRTMRIMHYSAWLARRWDDPAFPLSFPWFNTERYWAEHILELREQLSALDEEPLALF